MTHNFPLSDATPNLLADTAPLMQAIETIDRVPVKIVLVVDAGKRLIGSITDGDIRRAVLQGHPMQTPVQKIMHANPYTVPMGSSRQFILDMMDSMAVRHIPLIDAQGHVQNLASYDELVGQRYSMHANPVVIMAGGKGTRLMPLTTHIPKPMLEVAGRPILEWILHRFTAQGFHNFYIAINHLGHIIEDHFKDGQEHGCTIRYVREEQPLGTAGALSLLPHDAITLPMLVINGDIMTKIDFDNILDFHHASGAVATVCAKEHRLEIPFGVIETEQGYLRSITEKPSYNHLVSAGIYVLNPEVLDSMPHGEPLDMPALLLSLVQEQSKVGVFPLREDWLDVGRPHELELAKKNQHA